MPIICLNNADKLAIKSLYVHTKHTQASLGIMYGVATSTINKVLQEYGLTTQYKKEQPQNEDSQILALLKAEGINLETLTDILSLWNPKMFEVTVRHNVTKEPA